MEDQLMQVLVAMDVACGRQPDELRARSLAFALSGVPLVWIIEGARSIAQTREPTQFPATAAEIHRAAWKAAGFTHKYNPQLAGDAAYVEPRIGDVRWWPEPRAQIATGDHWDWLPPAGAVGVIGSSVVKPAQLGDGESLGSILETMHTEDAR